MTIAIAWVRSIHNCEELLFVTDSRLSGDGRNFDGCPKIMILPRGDCAMAFAGYTGHAFPMMQQLAFAIESHGPLFRGSLDLFPLRKHTLNIFDEMSSLISSSDRLSTPAATDPEANFILGGYSWIRKQFEIWTISYRSLERRFVAEPAKWLSYSSNAKKVIIRKKRAGLGAIAGRIAFAGDQASEAQRRLAEMLHSADQLGAPIKLDMQPFQVVRDMLRDPQHSETIGGAPQLVKIYQYMKSAPLAVYWPTKRNGRPHLHGRPCLSYERIDRWTIDPDTLRSEQTSPADDYELPESNES